MLKPIQMQIPTVTEMQKVMLKQILTATPTLTLTPIPTVTEMQKVMLKQIPTDLPTPIPIRNELKLYNQ
jgi:hypothetical protein